MAVDVGTGRVVGLARADAARADVAAVNVIRKVFRCAGDVRKARRGT